MHPAVAQRVLLCHGKECSQDIAGDQGIWWDLFLEVRILPSPPLQTPVPLVGGFFCYIREQPGDIRVHVMLLWRCLARRGKTARRNFVLGTIPLLHENRCYVIRAARNGRDLSGSLDGGVLVPGAFTPHATITGFRGGSFCEVSGVTQTGQVGRPHCLTDRKRAGRNVQGKV